MGKLTLISEGEGNELPEVQCSNCEVTFSVVFNRNPDYDRIEFCPFCGEEIEQND